MGSIPCGTPLLERHDKGSQTRLDLFVGVVDMLGVLIVSTIPGLNVSK